jgi:hypothetical protein
MPPARREGDRDGDGIPDRKERRQERERAERERGEPMPDERKKKPKPEPTPRPDPSPGGGGNPTPGDPIRNLQNLRSGQTLLLPAGTFKLPASGISLRNLKNVAVKGQGPERTILDASACRNALGGLDLRDVTAVTLEGFAVVDAPGQSEQSGCCGIYAERAVTLKLLRLALRRNWYDGVLLTFTTDLLVEDCEASDTRAGHGLYLSRPTLRAVVRRCRLLRNHKTGSQINSRSGEKLTGLQYLDNEFRGNGRINAGGASFQVSGVSDLLCRGNRILEAKRGIVLWEGDSGQAPRGVILDGNTIEASGTGIQEAPGTQVDVRPNNRIQGNPPRSRG